MHTLYFTRHGETVWNVENKICGMTDSPLTERGRQQARKLGEAVKASGVHIDEILYSPLSRAADTAMAIAEATGLPARCEPRLREQCFGKYEGTPRNGGEFRVSKTHFADRYDGGESMMQLAQRIYNLLDELKADTDKTYLLVAHNGIARVVQSYFYDMTNEDVTKPVGEVRLTFMNGEELLTTGFVANDATSLTTPIISAPEGKKFAGWVRESVDENGTKTLTIMFVPDESGNVTLPAGSTLEPMTLYALFEDI